MDAVSSYLQSQYTTSAANSSAATATSAVSSISSESSREEIEESVKSFESYMVEQVIKNVKESMTSDDDDEDSTMSMYKDYYMDSAISTIASELVDELGGSFTDDMVDQIMRNYGITETVSEETTSEE